MTGENFKRINRKNTTIENLKEQIAETKEKISKIYKADHDAYRDDIPYDIDYEYINKLENKIKVLENKLWYAQEADNRRRTWK